MKINLDLWKQPHTGGVTLCALFSFALGLWFFIESVAYSWEKKAEINKAEQESREFALQLKTLKAYRKFREEKPKLFKTFKKRERTAPLTVASLTKALYKIQKRTGVEFLFIDPAITFENGGTKAKVALRLKVSRDYRFFGFLRKLETESPGIVKITDFELRRDKELTPGIARRLKGGEKTGLFEGFVNFEIIHEPFIQKNR